MKKNIKSISMMESYHLSSDNAIHNCNNTAPTNYFYSFDLEEANKNILKFLRVKEWRPFFLILFFGLLSSRAFLFPAEKILLLFLMTFSFLAFG
jgi:menaquinone-dependent protoporphyrinogen IX oxidase